MRQAIALASALAFCLACGSSNDPSPAPSGGGTTSTPQTPNALDSDGGGGSNSSTRTVAIAIKGQGAVASRDLTVSCSSDGTTTSGKCTAYFEANLFASATYGWQFDHWEPSGNEDPALLVTLATPDAVTAVFVPIAGAQH